MITKRDILNMVQAVYRHDRGLPSRRLIYPAREWGLGVLLTVVLVVVVCIVAGRTYLTLDQIQDRLDPPVVQTVRYDVATAERTRELFTERTNTYQHLVGGAPVVPAATTNTAAGVSAEPTDTTTEESVEEGGPGELEVF
mgnify:CR=1 FL=1